MNQDSYPNPNQPNQQGSSGLPPVQPQQYPQNTQQGYPQQPQYSQNTNPYQQPQYSSYPEQQYAQDPYQQTAQYGPQPQSLNSYQTPSPNDDTTTVDYLNKIAPKEQKTLNKIAVFALIGAIIASAIVIMIILINPGKPSTNNLIQPISDRADTLETVVGDNEGRLSQTEIAEANTALDSTLSTISSQLKTIIKERKIKKTSTKTEKAYLTALQDKLDSAYQKGTLDRSYTTTMTYELTIFKTQLSKLQKTSTDSSIKSFCKESISNIDTILTAYNNFTASKS